MNARPKDPSATLYAPASTCVVTKYYDGVISCEAIHYGYGLAYVQENQLFYDHLNFITREKQLSFMLSQVTNVSEERDAVNDIMGW